MDLVCLSSKRTESDISDTSTEVVKIIEKEFESVAIKRDFMIPVVLELVNKVSFLLNFALRWKRQTGMSFEPSDRLKHCLLFFFPMSEGA